MALRDEFVRTGNWLFRWRSYLPIVLIPPVLLAMWHYRYPRGEPRLGYLWELFCLVVALAGQAVRLMVAGHVPGGTSGRNTAEGQVARTLNSTGLYSVVRHPLYLGNFLMWYGIALLPRSLWIAVVLPLLYWLYYERIMFAEEDFLRGQFGPAYDEWASRTPAFLPRWRQWRAPALPFSMRTAMRREYSGVFAVVVAFALLHHIGIARVEGRARLDPYWLAILAAGLVFYLTLRTMKKRGALRVEGR